MSNKLFFNNSGEAKTLAELGGAISRSSEPYARAVELRGIGRGANLLVVGVGRLGRTNSHSVSLLNPVLEGNPTRLLTH